jgi:GNAT superfamily N-acetyltransferase
MSSIRVEEMAPRWLSSLCQLLGSESRGCYCRYWHYQEGPHDWIGRCHLEPERNRSELCEAVEAQARPAGVVAVDDDEVVGWLKLAVASELPKLYEQRLYRGLPCFDGERDAVWVIGCVLVASSARRRGVARALIEGATDCARRHGARAIEALPRRPGREVRDEELLMGPASSYQALGFEHVGGEDPYPVLRLRLATGGAG